METLKVRYSSFKGSSEKALSKSSSVTEELGICKPKAEKPVYYHLSQRARRSRVQDGEIYVSKKCNQEKRNQIKKNEQVSVEEKQSKNTEKQTRQQHKQMDEQQCIVLLRERILAVVNELKCKNKTKRTKIHGYFKLTAKHPHEFSKRRPYTAIQKLTSPRDKIKTPIRPKSQDNSNEGKLQGPLYAETLSSAEKVMLKKVLSDILHKKLKEEKESQISSRSFHTSIPTIPSGRATAGSRSARTSGRATPLEICTDILRQKVKEKMTNFNDTATCDVTSEGDMPRMDVKGYKHSQACDHEKQPALLSAASSSRGSTAEWVMKQKFEKYRR